MFNSNTLVVVADPLVNSIITDIIKTLINNSYTYSKIEQRMMPTLIGILNSNPKLETGEEFKDLTSLLTVIKANTYNNTYVKIEQFIYL